MALTEYICTKRCYHGRGETIGGIAPPRKVYEVGEVEYFDPETETVPVTFALPSEVADPPLTDAQERKRIARGLRAPVDLEKLARYNKLREEQAKAHDPIDGIKRAAAEAKEAKAAGVKVAAGPNGELSAKK